MTWIISMILALVVAIIVFAIGTNFRRTAQRRIARSDEALTSSMGEFEQEWARSAGKSSAAAADQLRLGRLLQVGAIALGLLWAGFHTLVNTIVQVPAGHVGIVLTFKDITGQVPAGIHAIAPWKSVEDADTRVQRARFGTENIDAVAEAAQDLERANTLVAFSSETQDVFIQATLNFRVDERDIQGLFTTVGPDYFNKLIRPRVLQIFKDTTVKFPAVEIAPSRETIREEVRRRLSDELERFSIEVEDLLIDDIDFQPAFKDAIEQKQVATQDAQREEERIRQRTAEAEQVRQTAQGTADAIAIEAAGQAEANRSLSESITDRLIQFQAVQRLSPNIQIALIPSGEGIIIDPATLVGQSPPAAPSPVPPAVTPPVVPPLESGG